MKPTLLFIKNIFLFFLLLYGAETILFYYHIPFIHYLQETYYNILTFIIRELYNFFNPSEHLVSGLNGSTDRFFDYIKIILIFIVAIVLSGLNLRCAFIKKSLTYLPLVLRLTSILVLFDYGIAKIYNLQFVTPDHFRLSEEIGNMSPMRLLWTFMGVSYFYKFFIGAAQICAAGLLIFRKTRFLGALMGSILFLNIFLLNLAFDAPLKSFSLILLTINLILLFSTPEANMIQKRLFTKESLNKTEKVFICLLILPLIVMNFRGFKNITLPVKLDMLYGEYRSIEEGSSNYPRIIIEQYGQIKVFDSSYNAFFLNFTKNDEKIKIWDKDNPERTKLILSFNDDQTQIRLSGKLRNVNFDQKYKYDDNEKLLFRKSHLINDYPFNQSKSFKRRKFY